MIDCTQLDADLKAAGLRIHGCASNGRIDWIAPPTQTERDAAAAVLAAHDPTKRERDEQTAQQHLRHLAQRIEDGTATNAEVREALAKVIRRLV